MFLCIIGTHSVEVRDRRREVRHSFRPISYLLTKSESTHACVILFEGTIEAMRCLFGEDVEFGIGISDRCPAIRNEFLHIFRDICWVACWPMSLEKILNVRAI